MGGGGAVRAGPGPRQEEGPSRGEGFHQEEKSRAAARARAGVRPAPERVRRRVQRTRDAAGRPRPSGHAQLCTHGYRHGRGLGVWLGPSVRAPRPRSSAETFRRNVAGRSLHNAGFERPTREQQRREDGGSDEGETTRRVGIGRRSCTRGANRVRDRVFAVGLGSGDFRRRLCDTRGGGFGDDAAQLAQGTVRGDQRR